ncbi:3530_t:CDS:2 [Rhizophagus irregularis]|nr:3530_t:CDS:2 [Rhizophagus irregularis]
MSIKVLKNKEPNAIKSKLARMIKYYGEVKAHNEKSGVERKDWDWYEKMDAIFGTRENIAPSFIVNRSTDIDGEESSSMEPKTPKRSKKNNVDTIAMAISTMKEEEQDEISTIVVLNSIENVIKYIQQKDLEIGNLEMKNLIKLKKRIFFDNINEKRQSKLNEYFDFNV